MDSHSGDPCIDGGHAKGFVLHTYGQDGGAGRT
jgi:hypothetical protein